MVLLEVADHVERLLGLGCPLEAVGFLQELIKGESSFAEARDESAESGEAPYGDMAPSILKTRHGPHHQRWPSPQNQGMHGVARHASQDIV